MTAIYLLLSNCSLLRDRGPAIAVFGGLVGWKISSSVEYASPSASSDDRRYTLTRLTLKSCGSAVLYYSCTLFAKRDSSTLSKINRFWLPVRIESGARLLGRSTSFRVIV